MPVIKQDTDNLLTNFGFHLQSFVHGQNVLDPQQLANTIDSRLSEDLATIVYSLHCLEAANKIFDIHLLVVTDDFTKANLTAILWARMQGIKSLRLGHGVPLCEEYTILASRVTDYMTVFGQRCLEEYADIGVDISKVVITGHPMWDQYTRLRMQKSHCRAQVCQKYGLRADIPIVVFATTYTAYLTAHSCPSIHADTARDFFIACRALREKNIVFNIVIKDRLGWQREYPQAQGDKVLETLLLDILGEEAQEHYRYVLDEGPLWATAADVVIGVSSNYLIEAMLAGTNAINLLTYQNAVIGPNFAADAGIVEVEAHQLADAILSMLNPEEKASQQQKIQQAMEYYNYKNDGHATERVVQLLCDLTPNIYPVPSQSVQFIWQKCLDTGPVSLKTGHHAVPLYNLLNMLSNNPHTFVDIGCRIGSNASYIKEKFPHCTVWGVEMSQEAARMAATRLDKVIIGKFEEIDLGEAGLAQGTLDGALLVNVLEYLYNPWDFMVRLRPYLSEQGQVLISVYNLCNLMLMDGISKGIFPYAEEGLLDITHIRFFTLRELLKLCQETGYRVAKLQYSPDVRIWGLVDRFKAALPRNIELDRLTLKNVTLEELMEMCSLRFYLLLEKAT